MNSGVFPVVLEAAARALAAAATVWAVLRLLRVHNVPAQKAAWSLVLIAALAMPFAMRWLPAAGTIRLPAIAWGRAPRPEPSPAQSAPAPSFSSAPAEAAGVSVAAPDRFSFPSIGEPDQANADLADMDLTNGDPKNTDLNRQAGAAPEAPVPARNSAATLQSGASASRPWPRRPLALAGLLYLAVAAVLLLRLMAGLAAALRLWFTAQPVAAARLAEIAPGVSVRFSRRVSSPVNIASGIVLPADFRAWNSEKLRIALARERSHVRQGDFYLQLLAGLYAALFWFSPLGWWLQRKLSELGEAIGDRAGLQQASSRSSYARLLLEFAALPHPTLIGVAMARTGNLAPRIERLLDDSIFRQAFAAGRRRALLAVLLVPAALFAASALVRVQAAGQTASPAQPAQLAAQQQTQTPQPDTGVSNPPQETITDQAPTPAPPPAAAPEQPAVPPPPADAAPPDSAPTPTPAPDADAAPIASPAPQTIIVPPMPPIEVHVPPMPPIHVQIPPMPNLNAQINAAVGAEMDAMRHLFYGDFPYGETDGGDAWALIAGPGDEQMHTPLSGQINSESRAGLEKARKAAHGPFFWFEHGGKSYLVEDPLIVAQIEALEKPMEDLRSQMRALRDQQRELSRQLRQQVRQQRQMQIPKPDLTNAMAELNTAVASLKTSQGNTISQQQSMQVQREIARIQQRLSGLESGFYAPNGQWGAAMSKLGAEEGKLGAEQGRLGGQIAGMAAANRSKIAAIIAQTLGDGKAKPVQ